MSIFLLAAAAGPVPAAGPPRPEQARPVLATAALTAKLPLPPATPAKKAAAAIRSDLSADHTGFTAAKGSRRIMAGELAGDFAHSRVVLGAAQGEREYGKNKTRRRAVQGLAQFSRDWGPQVTSVSQLSVASSSPVFAKLRVQQELELKPGGGTVVRVGGRFSRHVGGLEVRAGMIGASHSFGGAQVGYRLSAFDLPGKRSSAAHLFSFKLKDRRGSGSTSLSAVIGSSLHEIDWLSPVSEGRAHSLGAKRVQPLGAGLGVSLALGQTWYDQPAGTYRGTKVGFGLSFKR